MQEKPLTVEKDEALSVLVNMGYPFEEALTAIDKCGAYTLLYNCYSYMLLTLFMFLISFSSVFSHYQQH